MVTGLPPGLRYPSDVPEWSKTGTSYDAFKFDVYCVGSYIFGDLRGREFNAPELESLCKKMTAADPKDVPPSSEVFKQYNNLYPPPH
ncbi:hypothetical protein BC829DRAFT_216896 [Chytridium lagenaria]|nr:hypothetical protein BC829DRAFT_216896 [Chytridium lagenaria]